MKIESRIGASVTFFQIFESCLDPGSYDCRPNTKVQCLNSHMEYAFNLETGPTSNDGNEDIHFYSPSQWRTVGVSEGTVCTTTIAVWCNDGKRSPSCVWYQIGNLIPKLQLYLIAVSSFHPSRSEASKPPEQIIQTLLPTSQIHTETDTTWGMQLEHHTPHGNSLT